MALDVRNYGETDFNYNATNVSYNAIKDVNFVIIKLNNVKSSIDVACEFAPQVFKTTVQIVISDSGLIQGGEIIPSEEYYEYGKTVGQVTSAWDNAMQASSLSLVGWFYYRDVGGNIVNEEVDDFTKVINSDTYLRCYYKSEDSTNSKKVIFYTWNGTETGNYVEYEYNSKYILQGVKYSVDMSQGQIINPEYIGYIYDGGWKWSSAKDDNSAQFNNFITSGNTLTSANLRELPTISTWYPGSQFICYLALTGADITRINNQYGTNYAYLSQITEQNIYFNVVNYYFVVTNHGTGEGYYAVDVTIEGTGDLANKYRANGHAFTGVKVLSTEMPITENIYAVQAYAVLKFTIDTDAGHFESKTNSTIEVKAKEYLETVTFFEVNNDNVTYYSKTVDQVHYIKLSQVQFESYMYSRANEASPETALYSVIKYYGLTASAIPLNYANTTQTINASVGEYVFLFYYKNSSGKTSIVKVCDTYFKHAAGNELEYYPTTNNVRFTAGSVAVSKTVQGKTRVEINKNAMRSSYVDALGNVYTNSDMFFIALTSTELDSFFAGYASFNKETALADLIDSGIGTIYNTNIIECIANTYIIGFYATSDNGNVDEVVKVTSNYIYINVSDTTSSLVYIQDLMFTPETEVEIEEGASKYSVTIDSTNMFTTKFDYKTNTSYNTADFTLKFMAFNGSQFKFMTDLVTNGFMTPIEALEYIIGLKKADASNDTYMSVVSLSSGVADFGEKFSYATPENGVKYYFMAYYVDAGNKVCVLSANLMEVEVINNGATKTLQTSVATLSNSFKFSIPSISKQKVSATEHNVLINTNYFNNIYKDYETGDYVSNDYLMFIYMSDAEIEMINYYYNESRKTGGVKIYYGAQNKAYENLTLEESLMFAVYYYRHRHDEHVNTDSNTLHDNLTSSANSIENIVSTYLADSMKLTNLPQDATYNYLRKYTINSLTDTTEINGGYYSHNLIAIHINGNGKYVEKVSSNYVNIKYQKDGSNAIVGDLKFEINTIDALING